MLKKIRKAFAQFLSHSWKNCCCFNPNQSITKDLMAGIYRNFQIVLISTADYGDRRTHFQ